MGIFVTVDTGKLAEPEAPMAAVRGGIFLVALDAGHRSMGARQWETRLSMLSLRKRGRMKPIHTVAVLAAVQVGLSRELPGVPILMTSAATVVVDPVLRVGAGRQMALPALHLPVPAQQRIGRLLMETHGEQRWLESLLVMASRTVATVGAFPKLTLVRIGSMAVHTTFVRNGLAEFDGLVAFRARHFAVLAGKRKDSR
jgi:hypothetical protein